MLEKASQMAVANGQQAIDNLHILNRIFEVDDNVVPFILKKPDFEN